MAPVPLVIVRLSAVGGAGAGLTGVGVPPLHPTVHSTPPSSTPHHRDRFRKSIAAIDIHHMATPSGFFSRNAKIIEKTKYTTIQDICHPKMLTSRVG